MKKAPHINHDWRDHDGRRTPHFLKDEMLVQVVYRDATTGTFTDMCHDDLWVWEKVNPAVRYGRKDILKWRIV